MNLSEFHDIEAEELLVASAFHADEKTRRAIVGTVRAEQFYNETCRMVWRALLSLLADGVDVTDPEAVQMAVRQSGGPWRDVTALRMKFPIVSNWAKLYHAAVVRGFEIRQLQAVANQITATLRASIDHNEDCEETPASIATTAATSLHTILTGGTRTTSINQRQALRLVFDRLQERQRRKNAGELITARTGVPELDGVFPWREDSIVTLVAPSGTGKSSFMAQTALFTAASGGGVTAFTHEMSKEDFETRIISQVEPIHEGRLEDGDVSDSDWASLARASTILRDLPLHVDECPATMDALEQGIRYAHAVRGDTWFLIDYAQLLSVSGVHAKKDKAGQMAHVGQRLLALRRELKVAILLLAQTVDPKSWAGSRPTINHCAYGRGLKEPSSAMGVMFHQEEDGETNIVLDLGKNRKGASDETTVPFIGGRISSTGSRSLDEECSRRRDLLATYEHTRPEGKPAPDESALIVGKVLCAIADEDLKVDVEKLREAAQLMGIEC